MPKRKHDLAGHPLYCRWKNMRQRCNNPRNPFYYRYGGRGIKVCDEWNNSFKSFYDWAIVNGFNQDLEIDRIDNNGNYEPQNCRFVTVMENCSNQRRNVKFFIGGEWKTLSRISRETGVNRTTLLARMRIQNLSIHEAIAK